MYSVVQETSMVLLNGNVYLILFVGSKKRITRLFFFEEFDGVN